CPIQRDRCACSPSCGCSYPPSASLPASDRGSFAPSCPSSRHVDPSSPSSGATAAAASLRRILPLRLRCQRSRQRRQKVRSACVSCLSSLSVSDLQDQPSDGNPAWLRSSSELVPAGVPLEADACVGSVCGSRLIPFMQKTIITAHGRRKSSCAGSLT